MKNTKTPMIKCTFSNQVHKLLNPNPVKNRDKWKNKPVELTDKEKIELFNRIVLLDKETTNILGSYLYNRREKRRVQTDRIERGVLPKKKTTKEEYENSLENVDSVK